MEGDSSSKSGTCFNQRPLSTECCLGPFLPQQYGLAGALGACYKMPSLGGYVTGLNAAPGAQAHGRRRLQGTKRGLETQYCPPAHPCQAVILLQGPAGASPPPRALSWPQFTGTTSALRCSDSSICISTAPLVTDLHH